MRIDLNSINVPHAEPGTGASSSARGRNTVSQAAQNSEDTADLSSVSQSVSKLSEQLNSIPDVRTQRVEALRNAMTSGTYVLSPPRIAEAMLAEAGSRVRS